MIKNINYQKIFLGITLTFSIVLEFCVRYFNLWNTIPYCDKIMHFFWGFNIFLMLVIMFKWKPRDALIAVFVWQMMWEFGEMIEDRLVTQPEYMFDYFYFDGIKDTITDLAGAIAGWLTLGLFKNQKKIKHRDGIPLKVIYFFSILIGIVVIIGTILSLKAGNSQNTFAIYGIGISFMLSLIYWYFGRK
ncbi:MAG TPA: hypothetical protein V6C58_27240 [Allocoleopsis sp.]